MQFSTIEEIIIAFVFIIPGFIIDIIASKFLIIRKQNVFVHCLYSIIYGIIHFSTFYCIYTLLIDSLSNHKNALYIVLVSLSFFWAMILGIIVGYFRQKNVFIRLLRFFKMNVIDIEETAWDRELNKIEGFYVKINLKNGEKIYGIYGTKSFASNDLDHKDIYLEEMVGFDEDKEEWFELSYLKGVLIPYEQIASLEIFRKE